MLVVFDERLWQTTWPRLTECERCGAVLAVDRREQFGGANHNFREFMWVEEWWSCRCGAGGGALYWCPESL